MNKALREHIRWSIDHRQRESLSKDPIEKRGVINLPLLKIEHTTVQTEIPADSLPPITRDIYRYAAMVRSPQRHPSQWKQWVEQ